MPRLRGWRDGRKNRSSPLGTAAHRSRRIASNKIRNNGRSGSHLHPIASTLATHVHSVSLPLRGVAGGIETWIEEYVKYSRGNYLVLGTGSASALPVQVTPATRFFAIDNSTEAPRFLPRGLSLALSVVRNRRLFEGDIITHRVELVEVLRALFPHRRIILVVHTDLKAQAQSPKGWWKVISPIYPFFERRALSSADICLVHSKSDFPRIASLAKEARLQEATFDADFFFPGDASGRDRARIIWVGRFEWVKDPLLALSTVALLASRMEVSLQMVGAGSLAAAIERNIRKLGLVEAVSVHSPVSQSELGHLMRTSTLLLHTSRFEGAPRTLVEAVACGLPIVACSEADPEDIVIPSSTGLKASNRDPELLASLAQQVIAGKWSPVKQLDLGRREARVAVRDLENFLFGE